MAFFASKETPTSVIRVGLFDKMGEFETSIVQPASSLNIKVNA